MTKKALLFAAVTAGCLGAACAQMPSSSPDYGYGSSASSKSVGSRSQAPTSAAVCTASPCKQTIKIDTSGPECRVVVDPNLLYVKHVQNVLIEWDLDAPDRFHIQSISFKDEQEEWLKEYRRRIATPSGKQFHNKHVGARKADVVDENSIDGAWYYSVVVTDGHTVCKLDPPIINGE